MERRNFDSFQGAHSERLAHAESLLSQVATDIGDESHKIEMRGMKEGDVERVEGLAKVAQLMNGHRGSVIRRIAKEENSGVASAIGDLRKNILSIVALGDTGRMSQITESLGSVILGATDAVDLYERLLFLEKGSVDGETGYEQQLSTATATAVGLDENSKWIDIIGAIFEGDVEGHVKKIIDEVGFIPKEIYTKRKFRGIDSEKIGRALKVIDGYIEEGDPVARSERTKLLNAMVVSGIAEQQRQRGSNSVSIDSKGVRFDLRGAHFHIPYGLIEDEAMNAIGQEIWLGDGSLFTEVQLRRAEDNGEKEEYERIRSEQMIEFTKAIGISFEEGVDDFFQLLEDRSANIARKVIEKGIVIPDEVIEIAVEVKGYRGAYLMLRLGEELGAQITGERLTRKPDLFTSHDLLQESEEGYRARAQVVSQPEYYNVNKIVQRLLRGNVQGSSEARSLVFRGKYKERKGGAHVFLGMASNRDVTRALIVDNIIRNDQRETWESIPEFDREGYERLENALRTFDYYTGTIENIKKVFAERKKGWQKRAIKLGQTAVSFILMHLEGKHIEANRIFSIIEKNILAGEELGSEAEEFVQILEEAVDVYEEFIYSHAQDQESFVQEFAPEIEKKEIEFGEEFLQDAKENCPGMGGDAYDEELSRDASPVRAVEIHHKENDPGGVMPFFVEESALEALRLDRGRPLINVVGGCRYIEGVKEGEHPLDKMSTAIMRIAHSKVANVGIPGTQSGIGVHMGRQAVHYRNQFEHLSRSEQAHVFAISPGGNTRYPGNRYTHQTEETQRFAMTPVDSIITPFPAEWGMKGKDRLKSRYINHIAYMEALYDRVSTGQERVTVAGNGGLYSIMEINESLKRGFDLVLIKDAGRFSEAAAALIENGTEGLGQIELKEIIEIVSQVVDDEVLEEWLRKDFGKEGEESEDHLVYRRFFAEFLALAERYKENVRTAKIDDLHRVLEEVV